MEREPFYEVVYHRNDWTLADAFRPQPGWGCRRYVTPASALGQSTSFSDEALIEGANGVAPEGYRLTKLSICSDADSSRVIWSTPADKRFVGAVEGNLGQPAMPDGSAPHG